MSPRTHYLVLFNVGINTAHFKSRSIKYRACAGNVSSVVSLLFCDRIHGDDIYNFDSICIIFKTFECMHLTASHLFRGAVACFFT